MSGISFKTKGNWKRTEAFLKKRYHTSFKQILESYGDAGVEALRKYTPVDSGLTAESWYYEITYDENGMPNAIEWKNSNLVDGWFNVAVMLQYGHGTRNGGYVEGLDYINPALVPIFDKISKSLWWEVSQT